jgi:hypothetical protein
MAVDSNVSREILREELSAMEALARTYEWNITPDLSALKVVANMRAHNGDMFILEVDFQNYKEWPPFFEFVDPFSGERGTRRAYPKSTDSLFHDSGPCICAPFNRKAYKSVIQTGPHPDWTLGDWMTSKANGYDWTHAVTIGDMLNLVQTRLIMPDRYRGRMG